MNKPTIPIIFVAGEQDPCIVNRRAFEQAVAFRQELGYHNCKGKLYSEMRHEILNETGKETVWDDLCHWIEEQKLYVRN